MGRGRAWVVQDLRMGCLSGHVHYATRILGFWMLTRAVTRSVAVGCFVVIVGWLLAAEARGGKGGRRARHFLPSMSPPRTRGDDALATVLRVLRAAAAGRRGAWCALRW